MDASYKNKTNSKWARKRKKERDRDVCVCGGVYNEEEPDRDGRNSDKQL